MRRWEAGLLCERRYVRASPSLEPVRNVVGQRADNARRQPAPQNAEQQHRIRAFYKLSVDQMDHGLFSSRPPQHDVTPNPAIALSPRRQTRVATCAWLSRSFTCPLHIVLPSDKTGGERQRR